MLWESIKNLLSSLFSRMQIQSKKRQMFRFINTELESNSESDSETESNSDTELMAKLKSDSYSE